MSSDPFLMKKIGRRTQAFPVRGTIRHHVGDFATRVVVVNSERNDEQSSKFSQTKRERCSSPSSKPG